MQDSDDVHCLFGRLIENQVVAYGAAPQPLAEVRPRSPHFRKTAEKIESCIELVEQAPSGPWIVFPNVEENFAQVSAGASA